MPVTKTATRALRSSKRKQEINRQTASSLEIAIRLARKDKSKKTIVKAISLTDRAAKKHYIHKNKAARIKSSLDSLFKKGKEKTKK